MKTAKFEIGGRLADLTPVHRLMAMVILIGLVLAVASFAALRTQADAAPQVPADLEDLMATAQEDGSVRVIVGLDVAFQPEGDLTGTQAVRSQRQRIETTQDAVLAHMTDSNATVIAVFQSIPYIAFSVDAAALAQLAALPQTTTFEEDTASPPALASSIPVIGADDAWAAGYTGSGQTLAILDTGVEKTHSYFSTGGNSVVSEACYSSNSVPNSSTTVCPGSVEESTAVGSGVDCTAAAAGLPDAIDGCRHGTHVAGIAAGDNGGVNIGVARDANIIAVQIFSLFTGANCFPNPSCVLTYNTDQIKGMERVYALRSTYDIAAVNMSIGGGAKQTSACDGDSRKAIIDNLRSAGIATVISAGNNGWTDGVSTPGCISTAVTVGATEDDDDVAVFSNVASFLDLLAPGVSIDSSVPGGGVANFQGTSMSAPMVTGAWAVVKQKSPSASVDDALTALRNTGTSVNDGRGGGSVTDMRRINLDLALTQFEPSLAITKTVELANEPALRGDPITYTVEVGNSGPGTATGVRITDTLPLYVDGADLDATATVTAGESVSYTLNASIASDAPYGQTITNTAYFSTTSQRGESSIAFTMDAATYALAITKTVELSNEPALRGDPITYTIEVGNSGPATATGVRITDTLPLYVDGTDLDATATVTVGESVSYTLNASIASDAPYGQTITNTAYYSHTAGSGQDSAAFTVAAPTARLDIAKTVALADKFIRAGDPLTYTIIVANSGSLTAVGVHITDTLPVHVIGTDLDTTTTVTAGDSVTYTLSATMADGVPLGTTITNTAYYDHASGRGESSAAFTVLASIYLPIVQK